MSDIKSILSKLNKVREKNDELPIDFLEEKSEDFLNKKIISTGSVYIDYLIKGHQGYTLVTGWEASGKSSFVLATLKEFQKTNPDEVCVIFDGEGSIKKDDLNRFGITKKNLIVEKTKKLEHFLDTCEAISKADDVGLIIIDSLKSFYSLAIEEKSAEDNTIGIEAKKYNARMPIILSNCYERNIPIIMTHQWRENPGSMGDPRVLSGGKWVRYEALNHIDFVKKDFIKDKEGKIIGHKMNIRFKKSKVGAFDPTEVFETNFYYNKGFDHEEEYVEILIKEGFIEKSGSWFKFPNVAGEEVKVHGKDNTIKYLLENKEDYEFLKNLLNGE